MSDALIKGIGIAALPPPIAHTSCCSVPTGCCASRLLNTASTPNRLGSACRPLAQSEKRPRDVISLLCHSVPGNHRRCPDRPVCVLRSCRATQGTDVSPAWGSTGPTLARRSQEGPYVVSCAVKQSGRAQVTCSARLPAWASCFLVGMADRRQAEPTVCFRAAFFCPHLAGGAGKTTHLQSTNSCGHCAACHRLPHSQAIRRTT